MLWSALFLVGTLTQVSEYSLTPNSGPAAVFPGPDGKVWFAEETGGKIGSIDIFGQVTETALPGAPKLGGITWAADGKVYATETAANKVAKFDPVTRVLLAEFPIPQVAAGAGGIITGADGNLWVFETSTNMLVRMKTSGTFLAPFPLPVGSQYPHGPSIAADGKIWFCELMSDKIASITTSGSLTEVMLPQTGSQPYVTVQGQDGAIYFFPSPR
jgi:virginiamycin B lyase